MSDSERVQQFSNYRYFKPTTHYCPKIALKIAVDHDQHSMTFAYAVCSSKDNFSEKFARTILDDRMSNDETLSGDYDTSKSLINNARTILNSTIHEFNDDSELASGYPPNFQHNLQLLQNSFEEVDINKRVENFLIKASTTLDDFPEINVNL